MEARSPRKLAQAETSVKYDARKSEYSLAFKNRKRGLLPTMGCLAVGLAMLALALLRLAAGALDSVSGLLAGAGLMALLAAARLWPLRQMELRVMPNNLAFSGKGTFGFGSSETMVHFSAIARVDYLPPAGKLVVTARNDQHTLDVSGAAPGDIEVLLEVLEQKGVDVEGGPGPGGTGRARVGRKLRV